MNEERVQELLFKCFGDVDISNKILDSYVMMDSEEFMKHSVKLDFDKVYVIYGIDRRLSIAEKKATKKMATMPEHYFVETKKLKEFFTPFVTQLRGDTEEEEPDLEVDGNISVDEQSEQVTVIDESNANHQEEVHRTDYEGESVSNSEIAGLCKYGIPIIPISRHVPSVIGLKESLTDNVKQVDLDSFLSKVKDRVLAKI